MFGWFDRKHLGWLARFMQRAPVFPVPGDGRYMRQPLYVGDFCNIIISCIEKPLPGKSFNISGTGEDRLHRSHQGRERGGQGRGRPSSAFPTACSGLLLKTYALVDKNPPFTTKQLEALVIPEEFEVIDWPRHFRRQGDAARRSAPETFQDPTLLRRRRWNSDDGARRGHRRGGNGLAAAYHAAKAGHQVTVFEADRDPGGMAAHFDFGGLSIERFYHFVCKADEPTFELMSELGIGDKMRWPGTSMGYFVDGPAARVGRSRRPAALPEAVLIEQAALRPDDVPLGQAARLAGIAGDAVAPRNGSGLVRRAGLRSTLEAAVRPEVLRMRRQHLRRLDLDAHQAGRLVAQIA